MDIIIIGGFLGSGKTTLVNKLLHGISEDGRKVAVVENEVGTIGVDQAMIDGSALEVVPLFGGCVCCEITGELIVALHRIRNEVQPDFVIVELTGMAMLDSMRSSLLKFGSLGGAIHLISLVDGSRWDVFQSEIRPLLEKQIHKTDLVLVNKVDVTTLSEDNITEIKKIAEHNNLIQLSAVSLSPSELWHTIQEVLL